MSVSSNASGVCLPACFTQKCCCICQQHWPRHTCRHHFLHNSLWSLDQQQQQWMSEITLALFSQLIAPNTFYLLLFADDTALNWVRHWRQREFAECEVSFRKHSQCSSFHGWFFSLYCWEKATSGLFFSLFPLLVHLPTDLATFILQSEMRGLLSVNPQSSHTSGWKSGVTWVSLTWRTLQRKLLIVVIPAACWHCSSLLLQWLIENGWLPIPSVVFSLSRSTFSASCWSSLRQFWWLDCFSFYLASFSLCFAPRELYQLLQLSWLQSRQANCSVCVWW